MNRQFVKGDKTRDPKIIRGGCLFIVCCLERPSFRPSRLILHFIHIAFEIDRSVLPVDTSQTASFLTFLIRRRFISATSCVKSSSWPVISILFFVYLTCILFVTDFTPLTPCATLSALLMSAREVTKPLN